MSQGAGEPGRSSGSAAARRKAPLGFKLALLGIAFLLSWALLEIGVLLIRGEQAKFPRRVVEAPWGLRYNDPGTTYRHKSADGTFWFQINDQGMRADRDYAHEKPPGVTRVVSLGDSYTIGYEVAGDETFSSILERELSAAGYPTQVLNAGVSGFSNAEELVYLEKELLKYDPDIVLVSFYGNDLVDNVRTGLFRLDDEGALVQKKRRYVPAGRVGNFLNSSWFFNLLSERSNAFVLAKEVATEIAKSNMVRQNEAAIAAADARAKGEEPAAADADAPNPAPPSGVEARNALAAGIFERMYQLLHDRDIALVVHSIPSGLYAPEGTAKELFPLDRFDTDRPGVSFVTILPLAKAYEGEEVLVNRRSHFHWARVPHEWAGKAIAREILDAGYLESR